MWKEELTEFDLSISELHHCFFSLMLLYYLLSVSNTLENAVILFSKSGRFQGFDCESQAFITVLFGFAFVVINNTDSFNLFYSSV